MYASMATEPGGSSGSGKQSEDWVGVSATTAVLLDGLSSARGAKSGCLHGTPWFVGPLGVQLLAGAVNPEQSLQAVLAEAIERVAKLHSMCDLNHPDALSTTVAMMRASPSDTVVSNT